MSYATLGKISLVIPAQDEAEVVGIVVSQARKALAELGVEYEIIVVDDGSSDSTAQVAMNAGAIVLAHAYGMGNGAAIKTGIRCATGDVVVMMDADGQHDPRDIPKLLAAIGSYGMVVGARDRDSITDPYRRIANAFYNLFASYVCAYRIPDLTSGFRAIHLHLARQFLYLLPNTFSYPTTLTLAAIRSGYPVKYIPITCLARVGRSKIRLLHDGFRFLTIIFKVATLVAPLRIFAPASALLLLGSLALGGCASYWESPALWAGAAAVLSSSVTAFLAGLVSEQISQLRYLYSDIDNSGTGWLCSRR